MTVRHERQLPWVSARGVYTSIRVLVCTYRVALHRRKRAPAQTAIKIAKKAGFSIQYTGNCKRRVRSPSIVVSENVL